MYMYNVMYTVTFKHLSLLGSVIVFPLYCHLLFNFKPTQNLTNLAGWRLFMCLYNTHSLAPMPPLPQPRLLMYSVNTQYPSTKLCVPWCVTSYCKKIKGTTKPLLAILSLLCLLRVVCCSTFHTSECPWSAEVYLTWWPMEGLMPSSNSLYVLCTDLL